MNIQRVMSLTMGAMGVAIGAFGAHALQTTIDANGKASVWETALQYYWIHTLALFVLAFSCESNRITKGVTWIWMVSIFLFSGSLMALALGAPSVMGAITPLGGVGFIVGWLWLLGLAKKETIAS